jgi:hypothetical protein
MSLDEYREYVFTKLNPNLIAGFSPGTCIGCHSSLSGLASGVEGSLHAA